MEGKKHLKSFLNVSQTLDHRLRFHDAKLKELHVEAFASQQSNLKEILKKLK